MDAVEFLEEQYRMCEALNSHCEECGLSYVNNKTDHVCGDFIKAKFKCEKSHKLYDALVREILEDTVSDSTN